MGIANCNLQRTVLTRSSENESIAQQIVLVSSSWPLIMRRKLIGSPATNAPHFEHLISGDQTRRAKGLLIINP